MYSKSVKHMIFLYSLAFRDYVQIRNNCGNPASDVAQSMYEASFVCT